MFGISVTSQSLVQVIYYCFCGCATSHLAIAWDMLYPNIEHTEISSCIKADLDDGDSEVMLMRDTEEISIRKILMLITVHMNRNIQFCHVY